VLPRLFEGLAEVLIGGDGLYGDRWLLSKGVAEKWVLFSPKSFVKPVSRGVSGLTETEAGCVEDMARYKWMRIGDFERRVFQTFKGRLSGRCLKEG